MRHTPIPLGPRPAAFAFSTKKRRLCAAFCACAFAVLAVLPSANAASGPAPASQERRVLSGIHTDAISVFAENGGLTLGTKADVDGNLGVRLDPNLTLFNVEESTRTTVPAAPSYAFLGVAGSDVWIAPETNPGGTALWPGFSTEGVPVGVVDGNQLTLRLESVTGPGTLHVFQTSSFGEPIRLFSSAGTEYRTCNLPRGTHAHANWAFSAAGNYTLTFSASALTNGISISGTQSYAFVVGNVPAPVATTVNLAASTNSSVQGTAVSLQSTVTPANAIGWVEFRDGTTVLGHDPVNAGSAALTTTNLLLGTRSVTARFVPQWLNSFSASTSAPVVITNTTPSGVPFTITGVAATYLPGETLTATVVGHTLGANQEIRWVHELPNQFVSPQGELEVTGDTYVIHPVDAFHHGHRFWATIWDANSESVVAQTAPVTIHITMEGSVPTLSLGNVTSIYLGDTFTATASGLDGIPADATVRAIYSYYHERDLSEETVPTIQGSLWTFPRSPGHLLPDLNLQLQVVRDGLAIAASPNYHIKTQQREALIQGAQGIFRDGQTLSVSATVFPLHQNDSDVSYRWYFRSAQSARRAYYPATPDENGQFHFEHDVLLADNNGYVQFQVRHPFGGLDLTTASARFDLKVTDAAPGEQLVAVNNLAGHYHQGGPIYLVATADPAAADNDVFAWEWQFPGSEAWLAIPGTPGRSNVITAEQALDNVKVRVNMIPVGTTNVFTSLPVTIFVDDHGAPARQQPTVAGATSHTAGDTVTLTRQLPANGPTILTTHRWERKAAGATEFTVIANATAAQLTFSATMLDDGAEYRVSILKPNGTVAYGPSPAVTLDVDEPAPIPLRQVVLDVGHIDLFELTWNNNAGHLDLKVKDDTTLYAPKVEFRTPEDVTVLVDTALSELTFGDDDLPPGFEFVPRNQPVYFLDQSQQDGLPWPGWSTERLLNSLPEGVTVPYDTGSVEFAVEVSGPGDVVTFQTGAFGEPENRYIDNTDETPDVIVTGSSIHAHAAWMFTEPGDYVFTVTPRAYPSFPSKANPLTGPARSYHFRVGPRPEFETVPEGFAASIAGVPESVTNGTPVNLELVLDGPKPAIGGYQWYRFIDGVGIETIPGATNLNVSLTANPWDGAQVAIFDPSGRKLVHTFVQFLPPASPPFATHNVNAYSDAPATVGVSWATVYDGRSPLTRQVVTLIPQVGDPIVQEVAGNVTDAAFSGVPAGTYTATVQAFNALGAGPVSAPSAPFTVQPPALSITKTGAPGGMATLTVATESGKTFQLLSAPTVSGPWEELGAPIPGTGQTVPVVVSLSGPAGFFRWRVVGN